MATEQTTSRTSGDGDRFRRRLAIGLALVFALAIVMGPGPGIYFVNPDPSDPNSIATMGSIPILYLWAVFWFLVQASVVLVCYLFVWDSPGGRSRDVSR
jgi:hypothetical protein